MWRRSASSLVPVCGSRTTSSVYLLSSQALNAPTIRSYAAKVDPEEEKRIKAQKREALVAKGLLEVTISAPHQCFHDAKAAKMITVPARAGRMGILAKHVPVIAPLVPGLLTFRPEEGKDEHYFVSGGFATVFPDSVCTINSPEIVPIDQLNLDTARKGIEEYTKKLSSAEGKQQKAVAEIAIAVYQAMISAAEQAGKAS